MSHDEIRDDATDEPTGDETWGRPPSTFEKIMVAAREAKRLNAAEQGGTLLNKKPTTLAIKNVASDGVDYRFRDRDEPAAPLEGVEFDDRGVE